MTDPPNSKSAIITGITGQDGSYLTEMLIEKGYTVHGIIRRSSITARPRLDHLTLDPEVYGTRLFLHYADLDDATSIRRIIFKIHPDEVYHLAGQSHVGASFEIPESTCEFTAMGTLRLLELLRDMDPAPKFLNVGSSEIFGHPDDAPQDEDTKMNPVNPYGVAKAFAVQTTRIYRDSFGLFCCNAIAYNHESPRRSKSFVTRKITNAVARIAAGKQDHVSLGNLEVERDWGFAGDYVKAMWLAMQHEEPKDYIVATGTLTPLKRFLEIAFAHAGIDDWQPHVKIDPRYFRPAEPTRLVGNAQRAKDLLGWGPSVNLQQLVTMMVDADKSQSKRRDD
ncbi:MAG: GDP-mannose 4,6-dehydratase [Phycisphaeraceae bacterium]|nr:GDP-mannose 4,6-dehydratase [Phycisphaeraceae bacterium]